MQHDAVNEKDAIYLYSKTTGYMKGWARETKGYFEGLAYLKVEINSASLPGVSEMTVNTNTFDVWLAENPEVLKKIAESYVKPEWTR